MATQELLNDADLEQVAGTPLFSGLPRAELLPLIAEARITRYDNRTLLFSRGDVADRFFVVLAGRVRLYILTPQGRESVIELIAPGQSFAEAAVFGSRRMPVNAEAEGGTRLVHIPARLLLIRIAEEPGLALKMMDSLARWQRHLIGRVSGFKARSPSQRLAAALLALTENQSGEVTVHLDVTKTELASHIGITPESLSRALGRLGRQGVTCHGQEVTIHDVARLRRFGDAQDSEGEEPAHP